MIRLENLSKYYTSSRQVVLGLRNINLEFQGGEFVVITGVSGSGKSTLLNVISGLDTYEQGKMFVNGVDFSHFSVDELEQYRASTISFIFQSYHLIDSFTVKQNIELPLLYRNMEDAKRKELVEDYLNKIGMSEKRNTRVSKLSGGEKQRVAIARAIAKDAPVIVADEPTGNLDHATSMKIYELLHEVSKDKLVIVVTHDESEIIDHATRTIRMFDGEVVEDLKKTVTSVPSTNTYEYNASYVKMMGLAIRSILSKPKKLVFTMFFVSFLFLLLVVVQGINLTKTNAPTGLESRYFPNNDVNRLVVTKYGDVFELDELELLSTKPHVNSVLENDSILDTELVFKTYDETYFKDTYVYFSVHSVDTLSTNLLAGRLPQKPNEVVAYQSSHFQIGEKIPVTHSSLITEKEGVTTDEYLLTVVGLLPVDEVDSLINDLYFTNEGLLTLESSVLYEESDVYLLVQDQVREVFHDIRIDNSLEDYVVLAFPTMFYDLMVDLQYIIYGPQDQEILYVDTVLLEQFFQENNFYLQANTPYEVASHPLEITFIAEEQQPHPLGAGVYMNQTTYEALFTDELYQISLLLDGKADVDALRLDLEELGYNTFYPARIQTMDTVLDELFLKLETFVNMLIIIFIVYTSGFFVLKNILESNSYDYHVHRMIGASNKKLKQLMVLEQWFILTFAVLVSVGLLTALNTEYHFSMLRYVTPLYYILIYLILGGLLTVITLLSEKRMFQKSILASFKDEVRL